jgi:hypothetical protein
MRVHIGRRVPKGFVELPGSTHLGRGVWAFNIKPVCPGKSIDPHDWPCKCGAALPDDCERQRHADILDDAK